MVDSLTLRYGCARLGLWEPWQNKYRTAAKKNSTEIEGSLLYNAAQAQFALVARGARLGENSRMTT